MDEIEKKFEDVLEKLKDFDTLDIATLITTQVVHHCVAAVVVTIAHNAMPTTTRKEKIQLYVAARAVSGMVADQATDRIERKLEKVNAFVRDTIKMFKNEETSKDEPDKPTEEPTTE